VSKRPTLASEPVPHGAGRMDGASNYNAWLVERTLPHLGRRVLDAGAGVGTLTIELAPHVAELVALEPESELLPHLQARAAVLPNVEVVQAGVEALPSLGLKPFDAVVCSNVLEHVVDERAALAGIRSVLRPGGVLLLLVPAHPLLFGEIDRAVGHVRRYTARSLRAALDGAGFDVDELRHVNPVGALGWLVASRLLRRSEVPLGGVAVYERLVPVLRRLDALSLPFGLSLWAVARGTCGPRARG
jgi:SAM-dependent methyltransferase